MWSAQVRERFPAIKLMADANSAYTLADADHLKQLDDFYLMMIEQPLAHDDIIDHAELQAQLQTPICLDECIRSAHHAEQAIRLRAVRHHQYQAGARGRIRAKPNACTMWRRRRAFRCGAAACWKPASAARTTSRCPRCPISCCRAMSRPASATGRAISSCRRWRPRRKAPSRFATSPASATRSTTTTFARITVRQETVG